MPWFPYPPLAWRERSSGERGEFDLILVTGDAYVDHPAWPAARVARLAEALGYRVAVIAQPDWRGLDHFRAWGRPRLAFLVIPGAMDSMVAGFTAEGMPRSTDRLSPGGQPGLRPKRAAVVYCQRLREAWPGVPIVLGGVEAALRRFAHVDWWESRVRDPILFDAAATVLVTGSAESGLPAVLAALAHGDDPGGLPQTTAILPVGSVARFAPKAHWLPPVATVASDPAALLRAAVELDLLAGGGVRPIAQAHRKGEVLSMPAAPGAVADELAWLARLRFNRRAHPLHREGVPALLPVQFSLLSHLGCAGACSFCAIALQQGRRLRSRPVADLVDEAAQLAGHPDFRGTIPDLGGPSANMYGWRCRIGGCERRLCLHPDRCANLIGDLSPLVGALEAVAAVPGVKHVFVGSGVRFDVIGPADEPALIRLLARHVSGQLKVAPEHVDPEVLRLLRKAPEADFAGFVAWFRRLGATVGRELHLVPYFMTAFPGSIGRDEGIRELVTRLRLARQQVQIFTPTPGSVATAMAFSGLDFDGGPLTVPRGREARRAGKRAVQRRGR